MRNTKSGLFVIGLLLSSASAGLALDQNGLTSEFQLPNRPQNSQDGYYYAVKVLHDLDAGVVRARESAVRAAQSTPEYVAAVKAVDASYQAFSEKKNAAIAELEKTNPVYGQMKSQVAALDAKIQAARQDPATKPEQFEDLYKNRDTFIKQWHQLETDAMDRAKIMPLRQQWIDACKALSDLKEKQRESIESDARLKSALSLVEEQKKLVEESRAAIANTAIAADIANGERASACDFLRSYAKTGAATSDAWWTDGWTGNNAGDKPAVKP